MGTNELFEILVGTYEEYLLGYKLIEAEKTYKLTHSIASHSHKASLRSIAVHNNFLASGGADECIHLYDLQLRKECGLLMHHSGTVTSLCFTPDGHYLISGSEDGSISMFAVGSWILDKVWSKAHKGKSVQHIAIHPFGNMALSVGNDCTLRTWNLVKGRCAYIVNIAGKCKRPEIIEWESGGKYFALVNENKVEIYDVKTGGIDKIIELKSKISCIQFLTNYKICIGVSTGGIVCHDYLSDNQIWEIPCKDSARIKCLGLYENWLISASSKGNLSVYDLSDVSKPRMITSLETSCRITCMTISHAPSDNKTQINTKKKKRKNIFKKEDEMNNIKESKLFAGVNNVQCYPPDQKWRVEILD